MNPNRLLKLSTVYAMLCVLLVVQCYFFADRQLAFFAHEHCNDYKQVLAMATQLPPIAEVLAPIFLALLVVYQVSRKIPPTQIIRFGFVCCLSILVAKQFRSTVSFFSGRYWPETWIDNNPSLIGDGSYGFNPCHGGVAYWSFPSGHMAVTLAASWALWFYYPKWYLICILLPIVMAVSLIGQNHHFVGDCIGGAYLGGLVGSYVTYFIQEERI